MRDVEADHRHVEPGREDALRSLGVGPDVELGRRRHVPLPDRAAHQHDPGRPDARGRARARRSSAGPTGTSTVSGADVLDEEVDRVLVDRLARRAAAARARPCPLSPWTCVGDVGLAHERPVGAHRDRNVLAADEREHAERVVGRLLERLVAVHGGDADELDLGARQREQERDRVVVAGIAVEDDWIVIARSISSTSAAVGSDGCAPKREAAIAPAAQARRERLVVRRGPRAARRAGRR